MANRSRGLEGDVEELAACLLVFESVGDHTQGERLHVSDGEVLGLAVGEHAGQLDDLGDPTAVGLLFKLDAEVHGHVDLVQTLGEG